jgi:hypothetical protein
VKTFLGILCVLSFAFPCYGQTEKITLHADISMSDCSITEAVDGVVEVFMFHVGAVGRGAVEFRAPRPQCWTGAVWIGDEIPANFLFLGSSQGNWLAIAYGKCIDTPIYLGKIKYFTAGIGQPCCRYPVLQSTEWPTPVTVDCADPPNIVFISGGEVTINETPACLCDPPLSVESSTWGRVKALYQ